MKPVCSVFDLSPTPPKRRILQSLSVRVVVHGGVGERSANEN